MSVYESSNFTVAGKRGVAMQKTKRPHCLATLTWNALFMIRIMILVAKNISKSVNFGIFILPDLHSQFTMVCESCESRFPGTI